MLRINRRTDYAIRVMLSLAKRGEGERLSTRQIQEEMLVPHAFLQRIIADLSRRKLIHTYPGPSGGLQLARQASSISLRDIYEAIEGTLLISDCLEADGECPLDKSCPVRPRWDHLQDLIVKELESITLEQLAQEAHQRSSEMVAQLA